MNTVFRNLFQYHFSENKRVLELAGTLNESQLTTPSDYSLGSIVNHLQHLVNVDDGWLSDIAGLTPLLDQSSTPSFESLRELMEQIEERMFIFLASVPEVDFENTPIKEGEDKDLFLWQILFHIINHGTDHRAQLHALLQAHEVKTVGHDYVFFAYENPVK